MRVGVAVVGDFVTATDDRLHGVGELLCPMSNTKERRDDLALSKYFEYGGRSGRRRAIVESQCDSAVTLD